MFLASCVIVSFLFLEGETAATLEQKPTMTKTTGKSARISCKISGIDVSSTIIHWYQQKEGEALKRILYVSTGTALDKGFIAEKNAVAKECNLNIVRLDKQHNAMYYCAYWDTRNVKIFGAGTKLIVDNTIPTKPIVVRYPPVSLSGEKKALLCLAKGMFPPIVQFKWSNEGEELLQTDKDSTSSLLIITDKQYSDHNYKCIVKHETGDSQALEFKVTDEAKPVDDRSKSKEQKKIATDCDPLNVIHDIFYLNVAQVTYTALIVKSVAYCGIVSFLLYQMKSTPGSAMKMI